MANKTSNKDPSSPSNLYLIGYNVFQTLGWLIILIQAVNHFVEQQEVKGLWITTQSVLKIFQTLAILEIVHCAIGIVPSSVVLTTFQLFSRVFLVWPVLNSFPDSQISIGYPLLLIAWSVTEVIRYSYYFLNILSCVPDILTLLRYTLFIGLYPMGLSGELLCIYAGLPEAAKSRPFSVKMPNPVNFSFDFYYALIVIMFLYILIFPQLYLHMFAQRRKILGGGIKKTE